MKKEYDKDSIIRQYEESCRIIYKTTLNGNYRAGVSEEHFITKRGIG